MSGDAKGLNLDYPLIGLLMLSSGVIGMICTVVFHAAFAFLTVRWKKL